jgi:UDP-N-acetylglucosamine 2-epimerase (non-hydrolysing)
LDRKKEHMQRRRILVVFGTRPEAIKMAPVVHELVNTESLDPIVCVTAQHRHMLDQVLETFGVRPQVDLDIMKPGQDLFDVTSSVLGGIRRVIAERHPDLTMVHGDTTTSFAAALASFYHRVPVAHVEAGLRTHDLDAPYPEEANRQLTARLTTFHFAPTDHARRNLLEEGIDDDHICVTGNTVVDALLYTAGRMTVGSATYHAATARLLDAGLDIDSRPFILVTGHRRESFGPGLQRICRALAEIASQRPSLDIIYPVHLNPNVQGTVRDLLSGVRNIHLIEPVDYEAFVLLMMKCLLVITDSGGIQEEAPSLGKPVLVTRLATERPEGIGSGILTIVGTDHNAIVTETMAALGHNKTGHDTWPVMNPYGDGKAAGRIARYLTEVL